MARDSTKNLPYADRDFNPASSALGSMRDRTYGTLIDSSHLDARYHFLETSGIRHDLRDRGCFALRIAPSNNGYQLSHPQSAFVIDTDG